MQQTIPEDVLERIESVLPHLRSMIGNLRSWRDSRLAWGVEKQLANNAMLSGAIGGVLSGRELYSLSKCCVGERYGGGERQ